MSDLVTRILTIAAKVDGWAWAFGGEQDAERMRSIAQEVLDLQIDRSAQAKGGSWFVALKGTVRQEIVRAVDSVRLGTPAVRDMVEFVVGEEKLLVLGFDDLPAPEGSKAGDRFWTARSKHAEHVWGIGATPADAIADFNRAMVTPWGTPRGLRRAQEVA